MQSIVNCLFTKGKEITQAGEILKLRLLMLFRLIEKNSQIKGESFCRKHFLFGKGLTIQEGQIGKTVRKSLKLGKYFVKGMTQSELVRLKSW